MIFVTQAGNGAESFGTFRNGGVRCVEDTCIKKKEGNTIPQNLGLGLMKPKSFDASTHHSGLTLLCDNVGPALQRARSSDIDACCQPGAFAARA
jgi:hypothetical protein